MDLKKVISILIFVALIGVTTLIAFAAEEAKVSAENPVVSPADSTAAISAPQAPQVPVQNENDTQWAWGEVVSSDAAAKTITLKYLDYETDQEKNIIISVDEKTTFENIKIFDEIKVKDTLSIDYMVGADGKNTAKNIGLESPDSSSAVSQTVEDTTKQADTQAAPKQQPAVNPGAVTETGAASSSTSEPAAQK